MDFFEQLDADLRKGIDRTDAIDELFQQSFLGDADTKEKVSWCTAKMAQNKVQDMRLVDIMISLTGNIDPQVRENIAWGIGEIAGAGIGDDRCVNIVTELMSDPEDNVRAMAAWAAGRLIKKLDIRDETMIEKVRSLLDDRSPFVMKAAQYALDMEE